jgi:hypothetical protein
MPATKTNVAPNALKWAVKRAAVEFGVAEMTLRKYLAKTSAVADKDGFYSTKQITEAIYGGLAEEKLATQRQITRKLELENAVTTGSVLRKDSLMAGLSAIADAMVSRVMASELSREAKEDLLKELAGVPVVLEETANKQSRLPRHNGQKDADEDED